MNHVLGFFLWVIGLCLGQRFRTFNWEAGDSYTADLIFTVVLTYRSRIVTDVMPGKLLVDPPGQTITILTSGLLGCQWVTAERTHKLLSALSWPAFPCYVGGGFNYSQHVTSYSQLSERHVSFDQYTYSGRVRDPGTCDTYGWSRIKTDCRGRIVFYDLYRAIYLPGLGLVKAHAHFDVVRYHDGVDNSLLTPPPGLNCSASFCQTFFPAGVDDMLEV